ncbi:fimbrial biogenesis chaperone [Enterobacillus tribolii]|uniref:Fimbrial chaperone protein n=1 Tax=Enterobacillus tribolii TaxID=1487935 RepID=A0A370QNP3_9GAMM|nr:fimbria/pilus periplasmic chaperone [Enterobacillus tribolii]MBW7981992.1 hypothetical protein [Enterobacillus tribolii]RDK89989.1 fimbrial chaperone protein [Enterobacillus tribolii]
MKLLKLFLITLSVSMAGIHTASAGGVSVGATRLIYPAQNKEITFSVLNNDAKNVFLIQSWVDDQKGNKATDFIITPPLFVIKSNKENILRIMYTGPQLAQDRETLFWLTVKSIPQSSPGQNNMLKLAIASRVKLFYRPDNLSGNSNDAYRKLTFSRQGNQMKVNNPTPYHVTLIKMKYQGKDVQNIMIAPFSSGGITLPAAGAGQLHYQSLNDFGANTEILTKAL